MAVTIHVNGRSNSLVHKGSTCIAKSTIPDVCKTPSPGGPVPIPYPVIISMSSDLDKGTKTVKVDGGNSAAIKGSEFSRCSGDEPGTAGGVKSSTNMKEATWILYSFDVKLEGKNACRLSDKMMMNHGNTACLGGPTQKSVEDEIMDTKCLHCGKDLDDPGHQVKIKSDGKLVQKAAAEGATRPMQMKGALKEGRVVSSGGGDGMLFNLATKRQIPLSAAMKTALEGRGNALGNCCEQKLLRRDYIGPPPLHPFPPSGNKIKMGITKGIPGKPNDNEVRHARPAEPCDTCKVALVAMLCTNDAAPEGF